MLAPNVVCDATHFPLHLISLQRRRRSRNLLLPTFVRCELSFGAEPSLCCIVDGAEVATRVYLRRLALAPMRRDASSHACCTFCIQSFLNLHTACPIKIRNVEGL